LDAISFTPSALLTQPQQHTMDLYHFEIPGKEIETTHGDLFALATLGPHLT
jgi:hypothetical protein